MGDVALSQINVLKATRETCFFFSANMLYTYHVTVAVDLLLFYHGDDKRFQRGNEVDLGMNTNPPTHMYDFFSILNFNYF